MTNPQYTSKPAGAWTAEQTVEYMFEKVLIEGDFYVICPDNDTTPVSNGFASPDMLYRFWSTESGCSLPLRLRRVVAR